MADNENVADNENAISCDAASCLAGVAVGIAIGVIGFALMYLSVRRRREEAAMQPYGENWYEKGNG
ncbi:hypothetical protein [Cupriavidus pinatubonensis]|uniref:hypothetical protein n=1 Tax=Cupriavidus pinatubonensis TaxID=248026 RepID=UPI00361B21CC